MPGWRRYIDRQTLRWWSLGATGAAVAGSATIALWVLCVGRLWALIAVPILSCLAWLCYWLLKGAIERGLAADRWDTTVRTGVKRTLERLSLWLLPMWLAIVAANLLWTWGAPGRRLTALAWMPLWMFAQGLAAITRMIRPDPPPTERTSLYADMKPVQSDHWGQRPTQS